VLSAAALGGQVAVPGAGRGPGGLDHGGAQGAVPLAGAPAEALAGAAVLNRLAQLRYTGALTAEEYGAKKAAWLGRL
jgi:hypothetical protein